VIVELKHARRLIEVNGWSGPACEPLCRTQRGQMCWEWDEAVESFSVMGALLEARAYPDGWYAIEAVVSPAHAALWAFNVPAEIATVADLRRFQQLCRASIGEPDLQMWLKRPERTKGEVLRAFVRAIERSKRLGERR
jgi:hypothetical protein